MYIHFVGIGGKGVSSVANFFIKLKQLEAGQNASEGQAQNENIILSGSDAKELTESHPLFKELTKNVKINVPQTAKAVTSDIDFLVVTPAVLKFDNPEINKAKELGIPIVEFSDFMRFLRDLYFENSKPEELEYWDLSFYNKVLKIWQKINFNKQKVIKAIQESNLFPFYFTDLSDLNLIAITGTDGKTTTSSMLFHLLKEAGQKVAMITTVEAKIWNGKKFMQSGTGLHQTTPPATEILKYIELARENGVNNIILEVTSHALVQLRVAGLKFDYIIFTNITQAHLNYHKNWDRYAYAKLLLIKHIKKGTQIFLNADDKGTKIAVNKFLNKSQLQKLNLNWYGKIDGRAPTNDKAKVANNIVKSITFSNLGYEIKNKKIGLKAEYYYKLEEICGGKKHKPLQTTLFLPVIGEYNLYNFAAASGVLLSLLKPETLGQKLFYLKNIASFKLPTGRMQVMQESPLIIVDFAHTPNGLKNALQAMQFIKQNVDQYKQGRIIVVFGTAGERDKTKRPKMGYYAHKYADIIVLTAEDPRREDLYEINQQIIAGMLVNDPNAFDEGKNKDKNNGNLPAETENIKEIISTIEKYKLPNTEIPEDINNVLSNLVSNKVEVYKIKNKFVLSFFEHSINSRKAAIQLAVKIAKPDDIVIITGKGHEQSLAFGLTEYEWNDIEAVRAVLSS